MGGNVGNGLVYSVHDLERKLQRQELGMEVILYCTNDISTLTAKYGQTPVIRMDDDTVSVQFCPECRNKA